MFFFLALFLFIGREKPKNFMKKFEGKFPNIETSSVLSEKEMNDALGGNNCSSSCKKGCSEACKTGQKCYCPPQAQPAEEIKP